MRLSTEQTGGPPGQDSQSISKAKIFKIISLMEGWKNYLKAPKGTWSTVVQYCASVYSSVRCW